MGAQAHIAAAVKVDVEMDVQVGGWQKAFFTGVALLAIVVMSYLIQKHRTEKLFCLSFYNLKTKYGTPLSTPRS